MVQKQFATENKMRQLQVFRIDEYDDHVELDRLLTPDLDGVDVPRMIDGKPVTVIGEACFFKCDEIKEVNIPDSVTTIGAQSFALCKGISELMLPDSIVNIGPHAFRDCRGLKKAVLPKNLKVVPMGMFAFCRLTNPEIILPEGLEKISANAFWDAGSFDLKIPDSVTEIGVGAFNHGPRPITKLPEDRRWFLEGV